MKTRHRGTGPRVQRLWVFFFVRCMCLYKIKARFGFSHVYRLSDGALRVSPKAAIKLAVRAFNCQCGIRTHALFPESCPLDPEFWKYGFSVKNWQFTKKQGTFFLPALPTELSVLRHYRNRTCDTGFYRPKIIAVCAFRCSRGNRTRCGISTHAAFPDESKNFIEKQSAVCCFGASASFRHIREVRGRQDLNLHPVIRTIPLRTHNCCQRFYKSVWKSDPPLISHKLPFRPFGMMFLFILSNNIISGIAEKFPGKTI